MIRTVQLLKARQVPKRVAVPWQRCYLMPTIDTTRGLVELIFTHYDDRDWGDIWYLDISMLDEPGCLDRLVQILRNVNIRVDEIVAAPSGEFIVARLTLSASRYSSQPDGSHRDRIHSPDAGLEDIRRLVEARFIDKLRFVGKRPAVAVFRNNALARLRPEEGPRQPFASWGHPRELEVVRGEVVVPVDVVRTARKEIAKAHRVGETSLRSLTIAMCMDDTGDLFKIVFGYVEVGVLPCIASRKGESASSAAFTQQLAEASYDVVLAYMEDRHEASECQAMVKDLSLTQFPADPAAVRKRLKSTMANGS